MVGQDVLEFNFPANGMFTLVDTQNHPIFMSAGAQCGNVEQQIRAELGLNYVSTPSAAIMEVLTVVSQNSHSLVLRWGA